MLLTKKRLKEYLDESFKISVRLPEYDTWTSLSPCDVVELLENRIGKLEKKIKEFEEAKKD